MNQNAAMTRSGVLFAAALSLIVALFALVGCSNNATQESSAEDTPGSSPIVAIADDGAVTFTDDEGHEVTVNNPERVIAGMGSFANAWELAGGTLVGASDDAFTSYVINSDAEAVGDFSNPNLEAIFALEPDFVILTSGTGGRGGDSSQVDLEEALIKADIPFAYFNVSNFGDYARMMEVFTTLTGRDDLYKENVSEVAAHIEDILSEVPDDANPDVLLMISYSGGVRVQNSSSQTGAILADLGANNIADEDRSLLSDFSVEALLEKDPDYIFVLPMGNSEASAQQALEQLVTNNPAWESLSAVQNNQFIVLEPDLFLYKPNDRWDQAYQMLYDKLYL